MNIHKPTWMPADTWAPFIEKYVRHDGQVPCASCGAVDAPMSVDHVIPRVSGGTHELSNMQPMCVSCNSRKGTRPDGYWGRKKYFDDGLHVEQLRESQSGFVCGPIEDYKEFFGRPWSSINGRLFLYAQIVGAGKTLGMFALPFALNKCVDRNGPRVDKMLIVTKDRSLRAQTVDELRHETVEHQIVDEAPIVREIESGKDLFDTDHHDIAVMCPNLLWPELGKDEKDYMGLEGKTGVIQSPGRTWREQVRHVIDNYPLIIFDETHYAHRNIQQFLRVAQGSLVFGFTASPIDRKGDLFEELVRMSVYGYSDACVHDSSMKWVGNASAEVIQVVSAEDVETLNGWAGTSDVPAKRDMVDIKAVVTSTVKEVWEMDNDPCEMILAPHRNPSKFKVGGKFPQHAVISVESVEIAEDVVRFMNKMFTSNRTKFPANRGWKASIAHSKSTTPFDASHPFFRYKNTGELSARCSRFLVVVDMAAEGMNNRYVGIFALAKRCRSIRELLQRIGRLIRSAHTDNGMGRFAPPAAFDTIKIITHASFGNESTLTKKPGALEEAWNFLQGMQHALSPVMSIEQYVEEGGLADEGEDDDVRVNLTFEDEIRLTRVIGECMLRGKRLSIPRVRKQFKGASPKKMRLIDLTARALYDRAPDTQQAIIRAIFKENPPAPLLDIAVDDRVALEALKTIEECTEWLTARNLPGIKERLSEEDAADPTKRGEWISAINELHRELDTSVFRSGVMDTRQTVEAVLEILAHRIVDALQVGSPEFVWVHETVVDLALDYMSCAGPTAADLCEGGRLDIPAVVFEFRDPEWQNRIMRHVTYQLALQGKIPDLLVALDLTTESLLAEDEAD